jgi:hypothetical protein
MYVLQPDPEHTFVVEQQPYHPLLPQRPGIFALAAPSLASSRGAAARRVAARQAGVNLGPQPASLEQALQALMDCPHPLETLADPGAYMDSGSISRYHNPDNYTRALGRIAHGLRWPRSLFAHAPPVGEVEDGGEGGEAAEQALVVQGLAGQKEVQLEVEVDMQAEVEVQPGSGQM